MKALMVTLVALIMLPTTPLLAQTNEECNFAEEPIRIGVLAPLSAPGAVLDGVQIEWVAYLAADHVNAACGIEIDGVNHRVETISGDSEGLPERGQAAVERMIFDDGIVGLVGGFHSAVALATMGILHDNEVPTIYAVTPSPGTTTSPPTVSRNSRHARHASPPTNLVWITSSVPRPASPWPPPPP